MERSRHSVRLTELEFEPAWIEGDETARWSSATGHGPARGARSSGSSFLEVPAGCRLPPHVDSAEETIVVAAGKASVRIDGEVEEVATGEVALVPAEVSHEVRNVGEGPLRFLAIYADTEVITTYRQEIQPQGSRQRRPVV